MSALRDTNDPVLREVAKPVPDEMFGTPELAQILKDMADTLVPEEDGVALAAPQIGIPYRIFIVRFDRLLPPPEEGGERPADVGIFINPKIIKSSRRQVEMDEGCLSVRGVYGVTLRHERATVRAQDESGTVFERGGGGVLAQAYQHEIDHLDGMLFIDHAEHLYQPNRHHARGHEPFIYFGTPYVARDTLEQLVASGYVPSLVVTSPDAPQGRGQKLAPCETKAWAEAHGLPVITPEKLDPHTIHHIREVKASYGIVVAYGKILPQPMLDIFPKGILNIHYSLLPKYRGASPVEAALLHNDSVTGVSIQKMVFELDAGDVLASHVVEILPNETTRELRPRLIDAGAELLVSMLPDFEGGSIVATPQDASKVSVCGRIKKEEGLLSLTDDGQKNWNKYRAYAESPGTYFFIEKNGKRVRVKIKTAEFSDGAFTPLRVVPEGKNETNYADLIRA
jgi:methionyl-tRNA formyltransferase